MAETVECQACGNKYALPGQSSDYIQEGASSSCPSCGSAMYRRQPIPLESEMAMRNMPAPGEEDMGGNPLQEGILADGGWQNRKVRDESFASVRASYLNESLGQEIPVLVVRSNVDSATIEFSDGNRMTVLPTQIRLADDFGDFGDFDAFGDDSIVGTGEPTHKFIISRDGQVYASPEPTTHEEVAIDHGLEPESLMQQGTLGVLNNDNSTNFYQNYHEGPEAQSLLSNYFGQPVQVPADLKPTSFDERWNVDQPVGGPIRPKYPETDLSAQQRTDRAQAIKDRGGRPFGYYDDPWRNRGGSSMEPYPWIFEAEAEPQFETTDVIEPGPNSVDAIAAQGPGIHAGPTAVLDKLGVLVNGKPVREANREASDPARPFAGEQVVLSHDNPAVLNMAKETVESGNPFVLHAPQHHQAIFGQHEGVVNVPGPITPNLHQALGGLNAYAEHPATGELAPYGGRDTPGQLAQHEGIRGGFQGGPLRVATGYPQALPLLQSVADSDDITPLADAFKSGQLRLAKVALEAPGFVKDVGGGLGDAWNTVKDFGGTNLPGTPGGPGGTDSGVDYIKNHPIDSALIAGSIAAAPFTGGASLEAGAARLGLSTAGKEALEEGGPSLLRGATTTTGAASKYEGWAGGAGEAAAEGAAKQGFTNRLKGWAGNALAFQGAQSLLGGGGGGSQGAGMAPPGGMAGTPRGLGNLTRTAEQAYEHPSSTPSIPGVSENDPEAIDPHEFDAQNHDNLLTDPSVNGVGGTDDPHDLLAYHLPRVIYYNFAPESGENDPVIQDLIQRFNQHDPDYLKRDSDPENIYSMINNTWDEAHKLVGHPGYQHLSAGAAGLLERALPSLKNIFMLQGAQQALDPVNEGFITPAITAINPAAGTLFGMATGGSSGGVYPGIAPTTVPQQVMIPQPTVAKTAQNPNLLPQGVTPPIAMPTGQPQVQQPNPLGTNPGHVPAGQNLNPTNSQTCPNCGAAIPEGEATCPTCQARYSEPGLIQPIAALETDEEFGNYADALAQAHLRGMHRGGLNPDCPVCGEADAGQSPYVTQAEINRLPETEHPLGPHVGAPLFPPCPACGEVAGFKNYPFANGFLECENCGHLITAEDLAGIFNTQSLDLMAMPETQHPLGPQTGNRRQAIGVATCPHCGNPLDPQGGFVCPHCNQPVMNSGQPQGPQKPIPVVPVTSANHQGPHNAEQFAAVAELLEEEGRANEITAMLQEPWHYADEMARAQAKLSKPPVDQTQPDQPEPAQEEAPPGDTMPMPGMSAPDNQMVAAIQKHTTPDGYTPSCPKCGSGTTGVLSEDGDCYCHACGNIWKKPLTKDLVTAHAFHYISEHVEHHEDPDVIDAPAADQVRPRDVEQEQDTSLQWKDASGSPLEPGRVYEVHSPDYDIPDIVRIEETKPDGVVWTTLGMHGLSHKSEISKQEAEIEQLSFVPKDDATSEEPADEEAIHAEDNPRAGVGDQTDLSTPHELFVSSMQKGALTAKDFVLIAQAIASSNTEDKEGLARHFAGFLANTNPNFDVERFIAAASGNPQTGRDNYRGPEPQQIEDYGMGQRQVARTAGAKFTPSEQRKFIDEQGEARNRDKLNLAGTHYDEEPDDSILFMSLL